MMVIRNCKLFHQHLNVALVYGTVKAHKFVLDTEAILRSEPVLCTSNCWRHGEWGQVMIQGGTFLCFFTPCAL